MLSPSPSQTYSSQRTPLRSPRLQGAAVEDWEEARREGRGRVPGGAGDKVMERTLTGNSAKGYRLRGSTTTGAREYGRTSTFVGVAGHRRVSSAMDRRPDSSGGNWDDTASVASMGRMRRAGLGSEYAGALPVRKAGGREVPLPASMPALGGKGGGEGGRGGAAGGSTGSGNRRAELFESEDDELVKALHSKVSD